jgi:murein L,D-transpeptidase YcbB/YkuD
MDPHAAAVFDLLHAAAPDGERWTALVAFYSARGFEPAWFRDGRPSPLVREVLESLSTAKQHGLDPADYTLPAVFYSSSSPEAAEDAASAELALTGALMHYAADLHDGRTKPRLIDSRWHIDRERLEVADWLAAALARQQVGAAIQALAPAHPVYGALRRALADYRLLGDRGGWPRFPPEGPRRLELGDRDPQVAALRDRLRVTDGPVAGGDGPELFDAGLEEAVRRFQRRHGLNDDGVVGRRTRTALGVTVDARIAQLRAAMERWRWMPRELGEHYVLVNVPAQRLWFYDKETAILTMRTIVGKYKRQTPTFSSAMSYFVLRPKWYVPRSIAVKDLVPKAQQDPEYYRRAGFTVYDRESGEPVDPDDVDWHAYGRGRDFPFRLVQQAGVDNALGEIKFMFPNPYGVYLHDTSSPSLFRKDGRFFSSGCIRVEQPLALASVILSRSRGGPVVPGEVEGMIRASPINRHLTLASTVPIHVVYMTAWADDEAVYFYDDVYKRDSNLLNIMKN